MLDVNIGRSLLLAIVSVCVLFEAGLIIWLCQDRKKAAARAKRQKEEMTNHMIQKLRPHFLNNTLATIAELCRRDPAAAEQTTIQLAQYLRGTLGSLKSEQPVSFSQELQQVQAYFGIVGMRFQDRLRVNYKIQAENFAVRAGSILSIVEEAVKKKMAEDNDVCSIQIESAERDKEYVVVVKSKDYGAYFERTVRVPKETVESHEDNGSR